MYKSLKLIHLLMLILFLGTIFTYVMISIMVENAPLADLVFGRKIILTGTNYLTLPALWILVLSGFAMGYKKYGFQNRFFRIKLGIGLLLLLNAHFIVGPAVAEASCSAINSLVEGTLDAGYPEAYFKETVFGAVNVCLTLLALGVSIGKKGSDIKI